jgi:hypothetical protein
MKNGGELDIENNETNLKLVFQIMFLLFRVSKQSLMTKQIIRVRERRKIIPLTFPFQQ